MPPETNPRLAFERLFGADDVPLDAAARARRARDRRSILDVVLGRAQRARARARAADRRKLDEYLTGVREIERADRARRDGHARARGRPSRSPRACPADFAEYVKLMFDLQVAALPGGPDARLDVHGRPRGQPADYPEIGVPDPHHPLTHHRGQPDWIEKVTKINTFHVELFAHFIGEAARRRRKATGRCSTTSLSSTAAASPTATGTPTRTCRCWWRAAANGKIAGGRHLVVPDGDADDQPLPDAARPHGRAGGVARRQHGPARAVAAAARSGPIASCRTTRSDAGPRQSSRLRPLQVTVARGGLRVRIID